MSLVQPKTNVDTNRAAVPSCGQIHLNLETSKDAISDKCKIQRSKIVHKHQAILAKYAQKLR